MTKKLAAGYDGEFARQGKADADYYHVQQDPEEEDYLMCFYNWIQYC